MRIYLITQAGTSISLDVNTSDTVDKVKQEISRENLVYLYPHEIDLIFDGMQLEDKNTLDDYSIQKDCSLMLFRRTPDTIYNGTNNKEIVPLKPLTLATRYIKNTNVPGAKIYDKNPGGTSYAYAAVCAYINTIMRIYNSKRPPTFDECFPIALYNGENGGRSDEAIRRLEEKFQYGVMYKSLKTKKIPVRDALVVSVIVDICTSEDGWQSIANGSFFEKPADIRIPSDIWRSSLVEGYDLEKDCAICKNLWCGDTASPSFDFWSYAAHDVRITSVYFTLASINGKTKETYTERIQEEESVLEGKKIKCAWMDELTAMYTSKYLCEFHPNHESYLKYYGYDVDQWINIYLKQRNEPKQEENGSYCNIH